MTMKLAHADILQLHAAAVALHLDRDALLTGLPPSIVAGIPLAKDPAAQLLTDLTFLNDTQLDPSAQVPIQVWLKNARRLSDGRAKKRLFDKFCSDAEARPIEHTDRLGQLTPASRPWRLRHGAFVCLWAAGLGGGPLLFMLLRTDSPYRQGTALRASILSAAFIAICVNVALFFVRARNFAHSDERKWGLSESASVAFWIVLLPACHFGSSEINEQFGWFKVFLLGASALWCMPALSAIVSQIRQEEAPDSATARKKPGAIVPAVLSLVCALALYGSSPLPSSIRYEYTFFPTTIFAAMTSLVSLPPLRRRLLLILGPGMAYTFGIPIASLSTEWLAQPVTPGALGRVNSMEFAWFAVALCWAAMMIIQDEMRGLA